ncbi:hypothetical protein GCM10007338_08590 [Corynebacterium pelargi]|nr:hypothetical protein GCM10007338_08590 [Corynebacterium pelargi]
MGNSASSGMGTRYFKKSITPTAASKLEPSTAVAYKGQEVLKSHLNARHNLVIAITLTGSAILW